ncbi:MAG TPA: hypothetical protein VK209_03785 [Candidatus Sulfotelmatobacter sp.]|nr:hypothetical protein [Candidatus Sulfotelmatobacter sp.]
MSLAALAGILKSGKVTVSTKDKEELEITAGNRRIDVNAEDKGLIKEVISAVRESGGKRGIAETIKEAPSTIEALNDMRELMADIAEELKQAGITVTLSYKGDLVVTVGAQANSKISRLITKTKALEINSLPKLIEMAI